MGIDHEGSLKCQKFKRNITIMNQNRNFQRDESTPDYYTLVNSALVKCVTVVMDMPLLTVIRAVIKERTL